MLSRLASDLYGNAILAVVKKKVPYKGYEAEVLQYCVKTHFKKMKTSKNLGEGKTTQAFSV